MGLDPVADFTPPSESRHGGQGKEHPLELLARKSDNFLNSTFSNVSSVQEMEEPGLLEICAADAKARGIADGDRVRVFNSERRHAAESAGGWQSAARSRLGETQLGEDDPRFSEH